MLIFISDLTSQVENLAEIRLTNFFKPSNDKLEFDIVINRKSNNWLYFANATFHLTFLNNIYQFDKSNLGILKVQSGLRSGIITGNNIPLEGYISQEKVLQDTLSLSFLGPSTFQESDSISLNKDFLLGHYVLTALDGRFIPFNIKWVRPLNYYQTAALKLDKDSLIDNSIIWYYRDDNVELSNGTSRMITFLEDPLPVYETKLKFFNVAYGNVKKTKIDWTMEKEYNVKGYKITRAFRPSETLNPNSLPYDTIYSWELMSPHYNAKMLSKGNTQTVPQFYGILPDTVEFRGAQYCYSLYANFYDANGNISPDSLLAQVCTPIPNAIIVEARIISPTGELRPTLQFKVDDDCYMTGYIIDEIGRIVEPLSVQEKSKEILDNLVLEKGTYTSTYNPPPWVSDGYYQFVLIAYPIEDNSIELSRSMVPFFLTRNKK